MEDKNNIRENLLQELPDYISGELSDNKIRAEIDELIKNDPSFANEYRLMKSALSFVGNAEHSSPDEVYFANLQSKILNRTSAKESVTFYSKLISYWKYLVPAVTVCIVILVYTSNMNNNSDNISTNLKTEKKTQTNIIPETLQKKEVTAENNVTDKEELTNLYYSPDDEEVFTDAAPLNRSKNLIENSGPAKNNSDNILKEDIKQIQIDLFNSDDEDTYEDDYRSLSPEQQKQILDELKKSTI